MVRLSGESLLQLTKWNKLHVIGKYPALLGCNVTYHLFLGEVRKSASMVGNIWGRLLTSGKQSSCCSANCIWNTKSRFALYKLLKVDSDVLPTFISSLEISWPISDVSYFLVKLEMTNINHDDNYGWPANTWRCMINELLFWQACLTGKDFV